VINCAGCGKALAQRFAAEDATVVLLGRALTKVQTVAAELGVLAMAVECDLASGDSVRAAFAELAKASPRQCRALVPLRSFPARPEGTGRHHEDVRASRRCRSHDDDGRGTERQIQENTEKWPRKPAVEAILER